MKEDQKMSVCDVCKQEIKAGQQSAEIYNGNYRVHVWSKDCGLKTTISTETVAVAVDASKMEIRPRTLLSHMDLDSASDVAFCLDAIIAKHGIVPLEEAMKRKYPLKSIKNDSTEFGGVVLHCIDDWIFGRDGRYSYTCKHCHLQSDSMFNVCPCSVRCKPNLQPTCKPPVSEEYTWWTVELTALELMLKKPDSLGTTWRGLWETVNADVQQYGLSYLWKDCITDPFTKAGSLVGVHRIDPRSMTKVTGHVLCHYNYSVEPSYKMELIATDVIEIKVQDKPKLLSAMLSSSSMSCTTREEDSVKTDGEMKKEPNSLEKQETRRDRPSML